GNTLRLWAEAIGGAHLLTTIPMNQYMKVTQVWPAADACVTEPDYPTPRANWCAQLGFKSYHAGGCNFAMGDGSARFISQNIDHKTYQLLGCRFDGQAVSAQY